MSSITITQVAQRAGVSMKTVSRVLNAEPHVREEVRERVLQAAKELRYRPKISARSLAGARSFVVGYLLLDPSIPYTGRAQLGALTACRRAGYHLLVESVDLASPDLMVELDRMLGAIDVDGVLLTPPHCDHPGVLEALDAAGVPYARIAPATDPDRSARVEADDRGAAEAMTRHLLGLGHRRIGFVMGPPGHSAAQGRLDGFREAMKEAGLVADEALMRPGQFHYPSGLEAGRSLLGLRSPPTAIFASSDLMAMGVAAAAHELGLSIPKDVSVAGFDDNPSAAMMWPSLTTVRQPISEMAAAATQMLIDAASRTPDPQAIDHRTFHCELVIRASTAPPKPE